MWGQPPSAVLRAQPDSSLANDLVYTSAHIVVGRVLRPIIEEALHETQQRQNLVGRIGGRRGLEPVELFHISLHHQRPLRRSATCRVVPENPALSLLPGGMDRAPIYSGDRRRPFICLGAPGTRTRPRYGAEDRISGGLLRRLPGQFRAGRMVRRGPRSAFR